MNTLGSTTVSTSVNALTTATANVTSTSTFTGLITANGGVSTTSVTASGNVSGVNGTFSGDVTADDFNTTSDKRLKSNINVLENALSKVKQLEGVSFSMNGDAKIGLIAQDVQRVLPEVVNQKEDGYLSVAYGNIVGLLIEAIKEVTPVEYVDKEIPTGLINGDNRSFIFSKLPQPNSEYVYLNGVLLESGTDNDYIIDSNVITFNYPIPVGSKLMSSYAFSGVMYNEREIPEGEVNGVNVKYQLTSIPKLNTEYLYVNGLLMNYDDYSIIDNVITFKDAPELDSKIVCSYKK